MTIAATTRSWPRVLLADGRARVDRTQPAARRVAHHFIVGSILAVSLVASVGAVVGAQLAEEQVLDETTRSTVLLGRTVVGPHVSAAVLAGEPTATREFDDLVRRVLVPGTNIVRVKIWTPDGTVVYSDDPREIGSVFDLDEDVTSALRDDGTFSEVSDLSREESVNERDISSRLLEVYASIDSADGDRLLLEAYYSYDRIREQRAKVFASFGVFALLGLLFLLVFQACLGLLNLRWLSRQQARLEEKSRTMAEDERRRVARDLHDGVVQDLVGASYVLSSAVDEVRRAGLVGPAETMRRGVTSVRTSIQGLRSMMLDIYPASLRQRGLPAALTDLSEPLRTRGVSVELDLDESLHLPAEIESTVFRIAQEAVRNVTQHAAATAVWLSCRRRPEGIVELVVRDNGVGLQLPLPTPQAGHLGLSNLADLALENAGVLEISSEPGSGTEIRLELPA